MVIWLDPAEADLLAIHDFIAHDSKFYARQNLQDIIDVFFIWDPHHSFAQHPEAAEPGGGSAMFERARVLLHAYQRQSLMTRAGVLLTTRNLPPLQGWMERPSCQQFAARFVWPELDAGLSAWARAVALR